MPEMDGFEASGQIRSRETNVGSPRVPIIVLTANAMDGDRERCLAGMDDYLSKPFKREQLVSLAGERPLDAGRRGRCASSEWHLQGCDGALVI